MWYEADDLARLGRAERMMVLRMCGVSLKDRKRSDELLSRLGIECVRTWSREQGWNSLYWHVEWKKEKGEGMHKDECDWSGGQKCSEENVELCGEEHQGYGYKGGNGPRTVLGGILLGVRPVLAWMPDIPCVFGVTDVKCIWWWWWSAPMISRFVHFTYWCQQCLI